ncbi:MAG: phosphate ABC transporter ATP-binding protein [Acidobacteriota bacterium]|nr:phosphate ABC transporter ATP-binding protein [Thermoanaerobaculaceae bacterium]
MGAKQPIKIENLSVSYGNQKVLKSINLEIPEKGITVILGPSGCGKSTLLKCFNRIIELEENVEVEGKLFVDGEDVLHPKTDLIVLRKKMGLLLQKPQVLPMSIYDNVAFGAKIHKNMKKKEADELVEKELRKVNLWDEVKERLKSPADKLSIGQQQRLCLARGLAVEPEIILGDEPTSALDPLSAEVIEKQFLNLKENYTIILVTHMLRQAKRLADFVAFIYLGELVEFNSAAEFFSNPKDERTKRYLSGLIAG